jgi:hypothetical protein
MGGAEWGQILSVFIACALKPGIVGLPLAAALKFSFLKTLIVSGSAGVCGSIVFGFLSEEIVILYEKFMCKFFPNRKKPKVFTKMNRFLVRVKKYFGITGIAICAPLFLSIPLGSFVAIRFFGDRHKTILYMSIASIGWTVILYFFYHGAFDGIMKLFR